MAWKAYNTVNGQILGETSTSGSAPLDYQLDALGSVVGTIKTNGTLENTYRYAGYGQQVSKTGLGADPRFQWNGHHGYRAGPLIYVRSRHYSEQTGMWTTQDKFFPKESALSYTSNPVTLVDPTGNNPVTIIIVGGIVIILVLVVVKSCKPGCPGITGKHPCGPDPCKYSEQHTSSWKEKQGWTVCCNGRAVPCVRSDITDPDTRYCTYEHEQSHADIANKFGTCKCRDFEIYKYAPEFGEHLDECLAWTVEAQCWAWKIEDRCGPPPKKGTPEWKRWRRCAGSLLIGLGAACDAVKDTYQCGPKWEKAGYCAWV